MAALKAQRLWNELSKAEQKVETDRLKAVRESADKGKQSERSSNFQLRGYVHCDLAKADRPAFEAWETATPAGEYFDTLIKLLDSGYIFKASEGKEGYQASLSAASVNDEVNGYVLTAFAGSADRVVKLMLYKHSVMMEGDWSPFIGATDSDFLR